MEKFEDDENWRGTENKEDVTDVQYLDRIKKIECLGDEKDMKYLKNV